MSQKLDNTLSFHDCREQLLQILDEGDNAKAIMKNVVFKENNEDYLTQDGEKKVLAYLGLTQAFNGTNEGLEIAAKTIADPSPCLYMRVAHKELFLKAAQLNNDCISYAISKTPYAFQGNYDTISGCEFDMKIIAALPSKHTNTEEVESALAFAILNPDANENQWWQENMVDYFVKKIPLAYQKKYLTAFLHNAIKNANDIEHRSLFVSRILRAIDQFPLSDKVQLLNNINKKSKYRFVQASGRAVLSFYSDSISDNINHCLNGKTTFSFFFKDEVKQLVTSDTKKEIVATMKSIYDSIPIHTRHKISVNKELMSILSYNVETPPTIEPRL